MSVVDHGDMPHARARQRLHQVPADAADAEYRDARIAEPPHAVLAEDERCPYKSIVHDETIFLTANEPIRILHKFR